MTEPDPVCSQEENGGSHELYVCVCRCVCVFSIAVTFRKSSLLHPAHRKTLRSHLAPTQSYLQSAATRRIVVCVLCLLQSRTAELSSKGGEH